MSVHSGICSHSIETVIPIRWDEKNSLEQNTNKSEKMLRYISETNILFICNITKHFSDGLTPEASVMDTELLIYFAFVSNINFNIFYFYLLTSFTIF